MLETMLQTRPIPSQGVLFIPAPDQRPPGWITYRDAVAFVIIDSKGKPRIRTGHICSWPGSHGNGFDVDNIKETIVWSDQEISMADNADDAHEMSFNPKDPCLIKLEEVEALRDGDRAAAWFQGIYSDEISRQISVLLSKPDLGLGDEEREKAEEWSKLHEALNANRQWWVGHG